MPTKLILSDSTIEEIKAAYCSGIGSVKIAKDFKISKPKILRINTKI